MSRLLTGSKCPICSSTDLDHIGTRVGRYKKGFKFEFLQCQNCWFSFVSNPWTEFEKIYSKDYYEGNGADPLADYSFELLHPQRTIRNYEWSGVSRIAQSFLNNRESPTWLDYGCGHGGLVRYINNQQQAECFGFEEGHIAQEGRAAGIPILTQEEVSNFHGKCDMVTAIEVIEHVPDPLEFLSSIRALLKKDGVLFLTTGNSRRFRGRIHEWSYALPEVHVSFFEPSTLALAMEKTGFRPVSGRFLSGFEEIIKFKTLKNLGIKERSGLLDALPWSLLSRLIDMRYEVSKHPVGIAI